MVSGPDKPAPGGKTRPGSYFYIGWCIQASWPTSCSDYRWNILPRIEEDSKLKIGGLSGEIYDVMVFGGVDGIGPGLSPNSSAIMQEVVPYVQKQYYTECHGILSEHGRSVVPANVGGIAPPGLTVSNQDQCGGPDVAGATGY